MSMQTLLWILASTVVLSVWLSVALLRFLSRMGDKHNRRRSAWWEWLLYAPLLAVCFFVGLWVRWRGR